jgi:hypothetical protein
MYETAILISLNSGSHVDGGTMEDNINTVIDDLLKLARHTEMVHHIPGRIRLRVLLSGIAAAREINLEKIRSHFPGILDIRVKAIVGSVVIQYDQRRIPPDLWTELSKLRQNPELAPELHERIKSICV